MIVGITGTQDGLNMKQKCELFQMLTHLKQNGLTELHHGDCIGADAEAHLLALFLEIAVVIHPPIIPSKRAFCSANMDINTMVRILEPRAYLDRNHDIVRACDLLIVLPKGNVEELRSGTWATYRFAQKLSKSWHLITPY